MSSYHRLDDVCMRAIDREHAKAHMRSAELIIDFVFAAVEKARQFTSAVPRRVTLLALFWPRDSRRQAAQQSPITP